MKPRASAVYTATLFIVLLLIGCATPTSDNSNQSELPFWRGRLALKFEAAQGQPGTQSFSAGFELSGNPQTGQLTLYTPMGTTAATLSWSAKNAILQADGDTRYFASLDASIKEVLGTEIPVTALFAWLAGEKMAVVGWQVDLSQHVTGRITARRIEPGPPAEIRLVLEK